MKYIVNIFVNTLTYVTVKNYCIIQNNIITFVILNVTNMNHRLQQFLAAENVSQAQFAEFLGVARASVSHILAGRNKPSYEFICSMMVHYPNLNMEWLLTGKGKMYKNVSDSPAASDLFFAPEKTETASSLPVDGGGDELFFEEAPEATPIFRESPASSPVIRESSSARNEFSEKTQAQSTSSQTTTSTITKIQTIQSIANQRKVLKVTILFDDGTYQEL